MSMKIVQVKWREYRENKDGEYDFDERKNFACESVSEAIDAAENHAHAGGDDGDKLLRFELLGAEILAKADD